MDKYIYIYFNYKNNSYSRCSHGLFLLEHMSVHDRCDQWNLKSTPGIAQITAKQSWMHSQTSALVCTPWP